jgi:hypothetical protein
MPGKLLNHYYNMQQEIYDQHSQRVSNPDNITTYYGRDGRQLSPLEVANINKGRGGATTGGGAYVIIFILVLAIIFFSLIIGVIALFAAIPATIAIVLVIRSVSSSQLAPSFKSAFKAVFAAMLCYLLLASLMVYTQQRPGQIFSITSVLNLFMFTGTRQNVLLLFKFMPHLFCIPFSALMLTLFLKNFFGGGRGYGRAILVTLLVILPSLLLTSYFALPVGQKMFPAFFRPY